MTDSPSPEALAFAKKWCPYRERLHDMAKAVDDFARQAVERERQRCERISRNASDGSRDRDVRDALADVWVAIKNGDEAP